ncbi:MAG: MFS transporter [Nocardioidaceae bacterium]
MNNALLSGGRQVGADARRPRRIAITIAVVICVAYTIDYVDRAGIAMMLPAIGDTFGVSRAMQGLLVTVFAVVYMVCQIPAGIVADRVGSRFVLLATLVLWSVFTALSGLAGTFAILLALRGAFGASQGFFPAAAFKAVSERTSPSNRATVLGVVMSSSGVAGVVAPLLVAPLLIAFGWRGSLFWLAGGGVVIGIVLWTLIPRPLQGGAGESRQQAPDVSVRAVRRAVLRSPKVWLFAGMFCGLNFVSYGLMTWVPSYLMESRGLSISVTGVLAAIPMLANFLVSIAGGWLFDRYFHAHVRWYLFVTMLGSAAMLALMTLADTTGEFILFESLAVVIGGLATMALLGLPMRTLPPEHVGAGMGVFNFGGQVAGVAAPFLIGLLADQFSFAAGFGLLAAAGLVAAGLALRVPRRADQLAVVEASA